MTYYENIKKRRNELKITQQEMANYLEITQQAYAMYETGKRKISFETALKIGEKLNISLDDLGLNYRTPEPEEKENIFEQYPELHPVTTKKIPLLGVTACGEPVFDEKIDCYIDASSDLKADFALVCKGDSMINARIHDGDIVFIQHSPTVDNGQIAAVSIENEVTLKRVYYYPEKNKLVLYPENPEYEPFIYMNDELDDIRILGRAVAFTSLVK